MCREEFSLCEPGSSCPSSMSNFYKTCYIPFELLSDNTDSILFFLRIGQADMLFLLLGIFMP